MHAQIRERLREMVAQGLFAVNDQLPAESELARALGVSRMTIRQAITPLVAEGLLNRVHGRGTYVAHPKLEASLARLLSFSEERNGRIRFDKEVKETSLEEITELVISEVRRARLVLAQQVASSVGSAQ